MKKNTLTLIQAQDRYIQRVMTCKNGHIRRVRRSAWRELATWAKTHGYESKIICKDADDMLKLEQTAED